MSVPDGPLLAFDAGAPSTSVAARAGGRTATRTLAMRRTSESLLRAIDETLEEVGIGAGALGGLIVLRGPGSFTGLRIALGTALGLVQALAIPAAALGTTQVLAAAGRDPIASGARVTALVDALRGEWYVEHFAAGPVPRALAPPALIPSRALASLDAARLVGSGLEARRDELGLPADLPIVAPGNLAAVALELAPRLPEAWDAGALTRPIYAREPAVRLPGGGRS